MRSNKNRPIVGADVGKLERRKTFVISGFYLIVHWGIGECSPALSQERGNVKRRILLLSLSYLGGEI